ncbi:ATP-dependent DNA ligase [Candidatus Pacearchaeota archaeon]|nr:ATP-dependent DNA ligase [Candidatus Pacearchaeota archaeon]
MREMFYSEFVEVYEKLYGTSKRLEKEAILAEFLNKLEKKGDSEWIYLLRGKVFPDYDEREFGISGQLVIKTIASAFGIKEEQILSMYREIGDLGEIAEEFSGKKRQAKLFGGRLTVSKVFGNLRKIVDIEGKGAVGKKVELIAELLGIAESGEAKYIVRTLLSDLRVGVADGILRDALASAFFEDRVEVKELIGRAYDICNDFAEVFEAAKKGRKELEKIEIVPGKPMNVMLAVKVDDIGEAFEACGKPAAIEHKYDGFRVMISKKKEEIKLFTRRLENVTKQFPDVVEAVKKNVKGESFILDSEVVGFNPGTKKYLPFEAISQRIKRKYDIDKLKKELPVEVNVFDVIYYNGKNLMSSPFRERRKILERIVKNAELKIRSARQIITDSEDKAMEFYQEALKIGEEGIMVKNLDAPYQQGRRVGFMVKLKPVANDFDLVIVGAEYGSGKRAGWLTSYIVACRDNDKLLEIGKVSSGLKEKSPADRKSAGPEIPHKISGKEGTSYDEMTKLLKILIKEEEGKIVKVKPEIVVSVTYQNIQKSPSYSSGYALRFPRITRYRPDRSVKDIASLSEIEREVGKRGRKR